MNHRRFTILHRRHLRMKWQQEMCLAMNTAATYRSGMREFDPMPRPEDFVFTLRPGEKAKAVKPQQSREVIASIFRALAARPAAVPASETAMQPLPAQPSRRHAPMVRTDAVATEAVGKLSPHVRMPSSKPGKRGS